MNSIPKLLVFILTSILFYSELLSDEIPQFGAGTTLTFAWENADGQGLGYDFDTIFVIRNVSSGSLTFSWSMGEPLGYRGSRQIRLEDLINAQASHTWFKDKERGSKPGTVSIVYSQVAYTALKSGKTIQWTYSGNGSFTRKLRAVGTGFFPVFVNDVLEELPTIVVEDEFANQRIILDYEAFPLELQAFGATEFDFSSRLISIATIDAGAGLKRELATKGTITAYGIRFNTNSAEILPESEPTLTAVIDFLRAQPSNKMRIEGHTDNKASDKYNQKLSQARSKAVANYLYQRGGISRDRFETVGYGESKPIASNHTIEGRAANRRVVLSIIGRSSEEDVALNTSTQKVSSELSLPELDKRTTADHPLLPRYPGADMIRKSVKPYDQIFINSDSNWGWVSGKFSWTAYRVPENSNAQKVFESYKYMFERGGFEVTYSCENQTCGPKFLKTLTTVKNRYISRAKGRSDQFVIGSGRFLVGKKESEAGPTWTSLLIYDHSKQGPVIVRQEVVEPGTPRALADLKGVELGERLGNGPETVSIAAGMMEQGRLSSVVKQTGGVEWQAIRYPTDVSEIEALSALAQEAKGRGFEITAVCSLTSCGAGFIKNVIELNPFTKAAVVGKENEWWRDSALYAIGRSENGGEVQNLGLLVYKQTDGFTVTQTLTVFEPSQQFTAGSQPEHSSGLPAQQLNPVTVEGSEQIAERESVKKQDLGQPFSEDAILRAGAFEARVQEIKALYRKSNEVNSRESFDLDALFQNVGAEPESILNWVKTNTELLPYRGALKGAFGTLMERRGNTLDRSLLLAALFERAGYETGLNRVMLNDRGLEAAKAAFRLQRSQSSNQPVNESVDQASDRDALTEELIQLTGAERDTVVKVLDRQRTGQDEINNLIQEARKQAAFIIKKSELEGNARSSSLDTALNDLREHWWLRVSSPGESFDVDLLFDGSVKQLGFANEKAEFLSLSDAVEKHGHTVTLRVVSQQKKSTGEEFFNTALEHTFNSSIQGLESFWLGFVPLGNDSGQQELLTDVQAGSLAAQKEWLPLIGVNGEFLHKSSIRDDGSVNQSPALGDGAAQAAAAANETASRTANTLSGIPTTIGEPQNLKPAWAELVAVYVVIETNAGGEKHTKHRKLFDLGDKASEVGRNESLRAQRAIKFQTGHRFLIQSHDISPEYQLDRSWQRLLQGSKAVQRIFNGLANYGRVNLEQAFSDITLPPTLLTAHSMLRQSFDGENVAITRPNVISEFEEPVLENNRLELQMGLDIFHNDILPLVSDPKTGFELTVEQGVFDTLLESFLINERESRVNAAAQLRHDLDTDRGHLWSVGFNARSSSISLLRYCDHNFQSARVVVRRQSSNHADGKSFWEFNVGNGNTLGYTRYERGSAFTTKIIQIANALKTARGWLVLANGVLSTLSWKEALVDCLPKFFEASGCASRSDTRDHYRCHVVWVNNIIGSWFGLPFLISGRSTSVQASLYGIGLELFGNWIEGTIEDEPCFEQRDSSSEGPNTNPVRDEQPPPMECFIDDGMDLVCIPGDGLESPPKGIRLPPTRSDDFDLLPPSDEADQGAEECSPGEGYLLCRNGKRVSKDQ